MTETGTTTPNPTAERVQALLYSCEANIASARSEIQSLADGIARQTERIAIAARAAIGKPKLNDLIGYELDALP